MKIIYRPHLKRRLKERKIPYDYPKKIYLEARQKFFDTKTDHHITVSKLKYSGKLRSLVISYDIIGTNVEIVTIHPISDQEISNKTKSGRWVKNEKSKR